MQNVMIKILVVDDQLDVEDLFLQRFRKEVRDSEFHFKFAYSAEEALTLLSTLNSFDIVLILSDINMPGMTGLQLLQVIREKYQLLKVMMVTSYGDENNLDLAQKAGADDFFTKPVDFVLLKEKIKSLTEK